MWLRLLKAFFITLLLGFSSTLWGANTNELPHDFKAKFIENKGQWNANVLFRAAIPSGYLFVEKTGLSYLFIQQDSLDKIHHRMWNKQVVPGHLVFVNFKNAQPPGQVIKQNPFKTQYNYFIGNNKNKWVSGAMAYDKVTLKNVYDGVDFEITSNHNGIKYQFVLKPNVNPAIIILKYEGAKLSLKNKSLMVKAGFMNYEEKPPVVYYEKKPTQQLASLYTLHNNELHFKINRRRFARSKLVIDPQIIFSTYSGSFQDNFGFTATYDKFGNAYSGGTVYNNAVLGGTFPATAGAFQMVYNGGINGNVGKGDLARDAGILKYSTDGKTLIYATYLGGSHNEQPHSMVVADNGDLYILGSTHSIDFPASNAYDTTYGGNIDIYVARLSPDGKKLKNCTFMGGVGMDGINESSFQNFESREPLLYNYADDFRGEIISDSKNEIYVATCTESFDFPIRNSIKAGFNQKQEACIFKLTENLKNLHWSMLWGGANDDAAYGIDLFDDEIYVSGGTASPSFFYTNGAKLKPTSYGKVDGFLLKLKQIEGDPIPIDAVEVSGYTFVGTKEYDQTYFVKVDKYGSPFVYGQTEGNYPIVGDVVKYGNKGQYITKFNSDLSNIELSLNFGGLNNRPSISPTAFLVDECERIFISGWGGKTNNRPTWTGGNKGNTRNMIVTPDAFQKKTDGSDFYLAVFNKNLKTQLYGTFFGGLPSGLTKSEEHVDGGTSRFDPKGVVYQAVCAGCGKQSLFPTTPGVHSRTNNSNNCNNAVFKIDFENFNKPPILQDTFFEIIATDKLKFDYVVTDPDEFDSIFLTFTGNITDKNFITPKPVYSYKPAEGKVTIHFEWTPSCEHITGDTLYLNIKALDKGCPYADSSYGTIKILVKPPPIPDVPGFLCLKFQADGIAIRSDPYDGKGYFKKAVLFKMFPNGTIVRLDSFMNTSRTYYFDKNAPNPGTVDYCYYLKTYNICDMVNNTAKPTCTVKEINSLVPATYMATATVQKDKYITLRWLQSDEDDFSSYIIYKYIANKVHERKIVHRIFDRSDTTFDDYKVKVDDFSYCYQVAVHDSCGHKSKKSNIACTIVIRGEELHFKLKTYWNKYTYWRGGTDHYVLERSVDTGVLRPIVVLPVNDTTFLDKDLDYCWGGYNYRVRAYEGGNSKGNSLFETSQSNEIYLIQPPLLWVPNAFTPNKDGHNDDWGITPVFVKEYYIRVFNRWGAKVYDSREKKEQWNAEYMRGEPFDNVFIYIVNYTGWDNSWHVMKGDVTVLE